jgi:hypothetical protein
MLLKSPLEHIFKNVYSPGKNIDACHLCYDDTIIAGEVTPSGLT